MRPAFDHRPPLAELPSGARVLDLGCGPGTVPYDRYPEIRFVGVDQYPDERTTHWPPNASLTLADSDRLPYTGASFDAAICGFAFEHFANPLRALLELDRILKTGAWLYLSVPRAKSLNDRLYRFTFKGGGHLQNYSLESFLEMTYANTGFKLAGYAAGAGGFTWLREVPQGPLIRALLFQAFQSLAKIGIRANDAGDFMMLFRLENRRGHYLVDFVCARCGSTFPPSDEEHFERLAASRPEWACPCCRHMNPAIPRASAEVA